MNTLDDQTGNNNTDDRITAAFGGLRHDATHLDPPGPPNTAGGLTTAIPVLVLVLVLAGVGAFFTLRGDGDQTVLNNDVANPTSSMPNETTTADDTADDPTPDEVPTSAPTGTEAPAVATPSTSDGTTPATAVDATAPVATTPQPSDTAPQIVDTTPVAVIGVAADDTLNARGEPGVDGDVLGVIPPFSTALTRYADEQVIGGSTWVLIGNPDARDFDAWVNERFLTEIIGDSDQPRSLYNAVSDVREALSRNNPAERLADVLDASGTDSIVVSVDGYFDGDDVQIDDDQTVTPAQLADSGGPDAQVLRWGYQDGSGEPVDATTREIFDWFASSKALTQTQQVGVNVRIHSGNLIDNAAEFFPGATIVEIHYDGDEGDLQPFTWETIRLAFQSTGDTWQLVGIAHDTWTI